MGMPNNLVMVRHGQSRANLVQKALKENPGAAAPEGFFDNHDSVVELSSRGVQQADIAGGWLREEFPDGFNRYMVSPHTRTAQTAGHLALGGLWEPDDRWRERDWGEYGLLNDVQREEMFRLSKMLKQQNKWYWGPPGGESLATGVRLRFEDILDTLHREADGKDVIAVTHGETMDVARFVLERLTPIEWLATDGDINYRVSNCQALQYSRVNPHTGEVGGRMEWRRSICAWDPKRSWNEGEWVHLEHRVYSDEELLALAEQSVNTSQNL